jgi:hypothetical protein
MSLFRNRDFLQVVGFLSGLTALPCAFLAWAARSDFHFRGCNELTLEQWKFTANCSDAQAVMGAMGGTAGVLFLVAAFSLWRLRHV